MRAVLIKDEKGPVENLYSIGEAPKPTLGKGKVLVKESLIHWKIYNLEIESSF
jgi:NADPH:quinone reductase-like Zn-dependent oxidoreductase